MLLGCVYVDPPEKVGGADAEISWWVVDSCVGTDVEAALDDLVPRWIAEDWPLSRPRYVGRDLDLGRVAGARPSPVRPRPRQGMTRVARTMQWSEGITPVTCRDCAS